MSITLELAKEEAIALTQILSQLPNSSNTYILAVKVTDQVAAQIQALESTSKEVSDTTEDTTVTQETSAE